MDRNYRIAIAIDFGTARSGYAYQFIEDKDVKDPSYRSKWSGSTEDYPKTPTEILFRPDGSPEAWGHDAKLRFTELRENDEEKGYVFIDNFKTLLHEGINRENGIPYFIKDDKKFSVLDLIAEFLRLIKNVALQDIATGLGGEGLLDDRDIRWALTVPAVWGDQSKQLMRRAAQMAGLIGEAEESDRLLLVLEPEAAAVHCQKVMSKQLDQGSVIMIVDAGGGTVDITVHEVSNDRGTMGLDELIPCGGGLHGSKYVDKSFREFLDLKLASEAMLDFQTNFPVEYTNLMSNTWENIKCKYDGSSTWRRSIDLPRKLEKILIEKHPQVMEKLRNQQSGDDTSIRLTHEDMEGIFNPTINQLIGKVKNQFIALEDRPTDILFLVGGFAESLLLRKRIQEEFSNSAKKIVVPDRPGAAVLLGAAAFGVNPGAILSRRSRLTYGKSCMMVFEKGTDPKEKLVPVETMKAIYGKDEEYDYCDHRFDIFVSANDKVPTDATVRRSYKMPYNQTATTVTFLSSPNPKVRYTDEVGVEELGSADLRLPFEPKKGSKKFVDVEMYFGETEIKAFAIDPVSGQKSQVALRFSTTY